MKNAYELEREKNGTDLLAKNLPRIYHFYKQKVKI